jgi:hypothetical protein
MQALWLYSYRNLYLVFAKPPCFWLNAGSPLNCDQPKVEISWLRTPEPRDTHTSRGAQRQRGTKQHSVTTGRGEKEEQRQRRKQQKQMADCGHRRKREKKEAETGTNRSGKRRERALEADVEVEKKAGMQMHSRKRRLPREATDTQRQSRGGRRHNGAETERPHTLSVTHTHTQKETTERQ